MRYLGHLPGCQDRRGPRQTCHRCRSFPCKSKDRVTYNLWLCELCFDFFYFHTYNSFSQRARNRVAPNTTGTMFYFSSYRAGLVAKLSRKSGPGGAVDHSLLCTVDPHGPPRCVRRPRAAISQPQLCLVHVSAFKTTGGRPRVRTSLVRTSRRLRTSREDLSSEDLRGTVSYVEYTTQHRTSLIFTHAVACAVEAT